MVYGISALDTYLVLACFVGPPGVLTSHLNGHVGEDARRSYKQS